MGFAESDPNSSTELTTGSQPNRTLAAKTAPWRTPMLGRKGPKYSVALGQRLWQVLDGLWLRTFRAP